MKMTDNDWGSLPEFLSWLYVVGYIEVLDVPYATILEHYEAERMDRP